MRHMSTWHMIQKDGYLMLAGWRFIKGCHQHSTKGDVYPHMSMGYIRGFYLMLAANDKIMPKNRNRKKGQP